MSGINFVTREDGKGQLLTGEYDFDYLDLLDLLEEFYPYILDSISKTNHYLEEDFCMLFDEIIFENKVVGFAAYNVNLFQEIILVECYILPEFRGNRLFFNEIAKMSFIGNGFHILQPTRNIVELLLDYAYAKKVTDDIVVSAIDFYFDDFYLKSDKRSSIDSDELDASHFYDLSICSTISVEDDEVFYHDLLENDLRNYGPRKELNEDYFDSIKELFEKNEDEYYSLVDELVDELPKENLGYDDIIGQGEGLSLYMQGMVDNDMLSYEDAINIKETLKSEYESGEITEDELDDRLFFLLSSNEDMAEDYNDFKDYLYSLDEDEEGIKFIKDFLDVIGDNEELSKDIFKLLMSDNPSEEMFDFLIMDAMARDDNFMEKISDLSDKYDDYDISDDDLFIDEHQSDLFDFFDLENNEKYKLYGTIYGKDYPKSYDLDIYRVLKLLKSYNDICAACAFADLEISGSEEIIMDLLINGGYVDDSVTYENWDEFANEFLTVSDLKNMLKNNNLKISGKKQELIDRVAENNIPLNQFKTNMVVITQKGENYLKEYAWIDFYEEHLSLFDFNDFYRYYETHEGTLIEIAMDFLDEFIDLANKTEDADLLNACVKAKQSIDFGNWNPID